jgi:hypothetical protein
MGRSWGYVSRGFCAGFCTACRDVAGKQRQFPWPVKSWTAGSNPALHRHHAPGPEGRVTTSGRRPAKRRSAGCRAVA